MNNSQLIRRSCTYWWRMLSTLCTSNNCFKRAYFWNRVCFTFISVNSGVVFTVDCAESLRTSHAVYSLLLLFHFHPHVLLTEVSYLPCSLQVQQPFRFLWICSFGSVLFWVLTCILLWMNWMFSVVLVSPVHCHVSWSQPEEWTTEAKCVELLRTFVFPKWFYSKESQRWY